MSFRTSQPKKFGILNHALAVVSVLAGEIACINSAGFATKGAVSTSLKAIGIFAESVDNSGGAAGDLSAAVEFSQQKDGPIVAFPLANDAGDACDQTSVGHSVYITGPNSVGKTDAGGTLSRAGKCIMLSPDASIVYVEFDRDSDSEDISALDARLTAAEADIAAGMQVQKKTVTVAYNNAALTATSGGANGDSAAVNIGTALPSNARIVGVDMRGLTVFTGGSVSAVTCDVGMSGDVDALVDGADLQTAAVDGGPSSMPSGIRPNKTYAAGGQLIATFTPDGAHKLSALSAGSVIIDVLYVVLA